jgi:small acid-soluble spore protein D (minor alpha/beta-type SASP)
MVLLSHLQGKIQINIKKEVRKLSRPKTPLVPSKREQLTKFKIECAKEIGALQYIKENNDHYKGDLTSYENGKQGGPIGGQMVKRMIEMAEKQL